MTKSDLIERLCQDQKLPKGKAELLVNTIFECLEESLRRGERIEIRGFGSFEIRAYKSYQGRNPKTGVPVPVKEKRLPFFKVGKELKERVNGEPEDADAGAPNGNGAPHGNGNGANNGGGNHGAGPHAGIAAAEAAPAEKPALATAALTNPSGARG
jgi:integration host factor subunit beta